MQLQAHGRGRGGGVHFHEIVRGLRDTKPPQRDNGAMILNELTNFDKHMNIAVVILFKPHLYSHYQANGNSSEQIYYVGKW